MIEREARAEIDRNLAEGARNLRIAMLLFGAAALLHVVALLLDVFS